MNKIFAACCIAVFAGFAIQTSVQARPPLKLVQTIPLPGVTGRLGRFRTSRLSLIRCGD
jgi:hypothetical protein